MSRKHSTSIKGPFHNDESPIDVSGGRPFVLIIPLQGVGIIILAL